MANNEINLEILIGKSVIAQNGHAIGRLEEIDAEISRNGTLTVQGYRMGKYAFLDRLAGRSIGRTLLNAARARSEYRLSYDKLDISDPLHPRLTCKLDDIGLPAQPSNRGGGR
jgi:sporulation protein YlmC with PRC-barrel domain